MTDKNKTDSSAGKDDFAGMGIAEVVEGSTRLTAEQQRKGREQRKIESRVCGIAAVPKVAS